MQVSVEKTSELSRKMFVSVPETVLEEKVAARLKNLARSVKIDGFRPGKAPANIVNKMYGERVRDEIKGDLIQSTYVEAIQEQKLNPAGYPNIHSVDTDAEGFKYVAEFELYPEVSVMGLDQLKITRPNAQVEDSDFETMLTKLREQRKTWVVVDRAAATADRVTLSFTGVAEGENFTEGKVDNFQVEIGAKKMIPGFEDNLIGLTVGEHKSFEISFPEDYTNEKLAGKLATFEVEITSIEAPELPAIDAELIKLFGVDSGDVEEFKADVKANMERELKRALKEKLKTSVMDSLYATYQFDVPQVMINNEINHLLQPYAENAKKRNLKLEDLNLPREMFVEQAKRRVSLGLLLAEIIRANELKVDPAKVRETIEELAESYEDSEQVVSWYYQDKQRLEDIEQIVLEDQVVAWIVSQAQVSDESISFDAAMNRDTVSKES